MSEFDSGGKKPDGKKSGGSSVWDSLKTIGRGVLEGIPAGASGTTAGISSKPAQGAVRRRVDRRDPLVAERKAAVSQVHRSLKAWRDEQQAEVQRKPQIPSGGGAPLPGGVQSKMERKLGADLSQVKVHTGADSERASEDLNAKAFTVGNDVHFNTGEFDPGNKEGEKLLAHELTHVVQGQKGGVQRKEESDGGDAEGVEGEQLEVSDPDDPAEKEADAKSEEIVADGAGKEVGETAVEDGVQRKATTAAAPQASLSASTIALAPRGTQGPEMDQRNAEQGLLNMPQPPLPPGTLATQNGVDIKHYFPNDHGPPHFHVYGQGQNTKVGQNGNPIDGQPELSARQRQCVEANAQVLEKAASQIMLWVRWAKARGVYPASAANRAGD